MTEVTQPTQKQIRYEIECLIDRDERDPIAITELEWMRETESSFFGGIPQSIFTDLSGPNSQTDRIYSAVKTHVIERYGLFNDDTEKLPGYEVTGPTKVPEWVIFNFLNDRFLLEEDLAGNCNNILEKGGGLVIEDRLVWDISKDESGIGWWISATDIDGHKLKAMYAGYLAGKCISLNNPDPTKVQ